MTKHCAIVGLPSMELERPPAAMSIIAGICKQKGFSHSAYDLNLRMYNDLNKEEWMLAENFWRLRQVPGIPVTEKINNLFEKYIDEIIATNPTFLLISVFSLMSNEATELFLKLWHQKNKNDVIIVAGGQGITTPYQVKIEQQTTTIKTSSTIRFAEFLKNNNLIDHFVIGDGEDALINILDGNFDFPGIDGRQPVQLENLDNYPIPVYEHLDPKVYKYTASAGVYVTASRGCVRACKFCDVPDRWPKFKYRKGDNVAKEILSIHKQYGATTFQLTDSVVNGNLKEFFAMNCIIAESMNHHKVNPIRMLGQFNVRRKEQMTEEQYKTAAAAGWKVFVIGVESGSEKIRFEMGKDFDNEDLDWHFYQCAKWGIQNVCLMFVGYPTETREDHKENLNFLRKYRKYMQAGTIAMVRWGYTGSIDVGSKLSTKELGFNIVPQIPDLDLSHLLEHDQYWIYGRNWVSLQNPELTLEERFKRRLEVHELSVELGYPLTRPREELLILKKILEEFKSSSKERRAIPIFQNVGDH